MEQRLRRGLELFNEGRFFESHEVLEEAWTPESGPRRQFLQAVIHVAVGFHHWERHNLAGARRQLHKALDKLESYLPVWEGVDTQQLYRDILASLDCIERGEKAQACKIGFQPV